MAKDEQEYYTSDIYATMSEDIIREKFPEILACGVSVGILSSTKEKKVGRTKLVLGECKKVSPMYRVFCPYDFIIIIYDANCAGMTDEQMKILLWHELEHIGIDGNGELYVKPHDFEDFNDIIEKHGLRWNVPRGTIEEG